MAAFAFGGLGRAKQEAFSQGHPWILAALHAEGWGGVVRGGGTLQLQGGLIAEAATSVFLLPVPQVGITELMFC